MKKRSERRDTGDKDPLGRPVYKWGTDPQPAQSSKDISSPYVEYQVSKPRSSQIQHIIDNHSPESAAQEINRLVEHHQDCFGENFTLTRDDGTLFSITGATVTYVESRGEMIGHVVYTADPEENAEMLHRDMDACFQDNAAGKQVTVMSEEDIEDSLHAVISSDGYAGAVVKDGGEIGGLYSLSRQRGIGGALLETALEKYGDDITHLECFDTFLPKIYARQHMVPVAQIAFNREYAPEGWDYEAMGAYHNGEPPILFMVDSRRVQDVPPVQEFDDYDDALEYTRKLRGK